jgi:DNA replication protein DnaC
MASLERELVEELKAAGAPPRDIAYAAANIPKEFWDITRDEIEVTVNNKPVYECVIDFVDNLHTRIEEGKGLTLLGGPKDGKTLWGCAILKSAAINPKTLKRDYDVRRYNYDTIIEDFAHIRNEQDLYAETRNKLTRADILFIDSISYTNPPGILLSIARTRRDFRKSTILATSIADQTKLSQLRAQELIDVFKDVNKAFMVGR